MFWIKCSFIFFPATILYNISFCLSSRLIFCYFSSDALHFTNCFPGPSRAFIWFIWFDPWSSIIFICCSIALTRGKYENLVCFITLLWSGGSISSPVIYSYVSNLPDDNADIFAASLLISNWNFLLWSYDQLS